jgi:hypothetical protein
MTETGFDTRLDMLASLHRRRLLVALRDRNPRQIAEVRPPKSELKPESDNGSYQVQMHHVHLPKLEANGFIDWDREDGAITKGPQFSEIRPLLELLVENQDSVAEDLL